MLDQGWKGTGLLHSVPFKRADSLRKLSSRGSRSIAWMFSVCVSASSDWRGVMYVGCAQRSIRAKVVVCAYELMIFGCEE